MKVLLLTPEYPPIGGGAANACFYLVKEMGKLGVEVDVLTSSTTQDIEREAGPSGEVIRLPVGKKAIHYWTYLEAIRYVWQARRFIKSSSHLSTYSIHHAFFTIPSALVAFPLRLEHPYIVSIRGSDVPGFNNRFTALHAILRPLTRMLWGKAAAVVSNSQGLKELAWKTMPRLDIGVIPNGIDTEEFYPAGTVGLEDVSPTTPIRLLAVNRLIYRKGMDVLFESLAELRTEMGDVFDLKIVGEGNLQRDLEDLSRRLGISDIVSFEGAISHENLPEIYRCADVFVLPSRAEGMSNALLEAIASGLPVIVTDTGGSAELVDCNGVVIQPGDPSPLTNALRRVVSDADLRRHMGQKSRERAEELSWHSVASQYIALYEDIYKGHGQKTTVSGAR